MRPTEQDPDRDTTSRPLSGPGGRSRSGGGRSGPAGRRPIVAMTRPDERGRFRQLILKAGWQVLACPLTGIEAPEDPDELRQMARGVCAGAGEREADVLLLTSARAVRSLRSALPHGDESRPLDDDVEVWVVGSATGRAARAAGFRVSRMPKRFHGDALVAEASSWRDLEGLRVWYPRSAEGRDTIPKALRDAGAVVRTVDAYRIAPRPEMVRRLVEAVRSGAVDAVPLTAGSSARALADGWTTTGGGAWPRKIPIVAIGPVTRACAERHGLPVHATSDPHTLPGLVECVRGLV